MLHAHSFLRWVVLILALLTIIKSFSGMSSKKAFTAADKKMPLFFMISMDIQLLLGLVLYFTGAWGILCYRAYSGYVIGYHLCSCGLRIC
jgi:hypothetical protein